MTKRKVSPIKDYRQKSLLSFVKEQPLDKRQKSNNSDKSEIIDSKDSESQDSDVICLETEVAGTSRIAMTTVLDTEKPSTSSDILTSSKNEPGNNSPDLFASDSDDAVLAAAMQDSQFSQTLAYGDLVDSQTGSQATDLGTPFDQMRLFSSSDVSIRKEKTTTDRHKIFVKTPTALGKVPSHDCTSNKDVWDSEHVRMPCSRSNLYPDEHNQGQLKQRWRLIETALLSKISSSYDIEDAVLSYNSRYKGKWHFSILHQLVNEEMTAVERTELFGDIIPSMVQLAVSLPSLVVEGVPLLKQQLRYSLTFSQQQLAAILANAFFCTFPRRNNSHRGSEFANYPSINMNGLFAPSGRNSNRDQSMMHKLRCLFQYFKQISNNMPTGCVTFQRKVVEGLTSEDWANSKRTFNEAFFTSQGLIEEADRAVQMDFANCMIGGGALRRGCVQEEIQFMIHPELIVACLFTERLADNEVLVIKGAQRYSNYTGYADTFRFTGAHTDNLAVDSMGRKYRHIIAMDATRYGKSSTQYAPDKVLREFNKAYCAFYSNKGAAAIAVATGNWGCGAFRGDHHFKGLLQMMVAAQCHRQLYYSAFGNASLQKDLHSFHSLCVRKSVTVGQLWDFIEVYNKSIGKSKSYPNIMDFITKRLR
ncbi:poly(ADP-ribose) glycohydrolase-like [Watersipora subatra]|uniref:poly(ADP-ribose) glycohydrolase-like n=1 Tax=Watersipora subatra TaxID=2589382 RepID=UPI00355B4023